MITFPQAYTSKSSNMPQAQSNSHPQQQPPSPHYTSYPQLHNNPFLKQRTIKHHRLVLPTLPTYIHPTLFLQFHKILL